MKFNQTNNNAGNVNNDISEVNNGADKSLWDQLISWHGILGSTASIVALWLFGWQVWHWWFFGL